LPYDLLCSPYFEYEAQPLSPAVLKTSLSEFEIRTFWPGWIVRLNLWPLPALP